MRLALVATFDSASLGRKLTLAFSTLLVFLVAVSVLAVSYLNLAQENFDGFVNDEFSRGGLARDVRAASSARAIAARNLIILKDAADLDAEQIAVKAAHERVQERVSLLREAVRKSTDASAEEHELFSKIESVEAKYGPVALQIVSLAISGRKDEASQLMNEQCQPLLKQLIAATTSYSKLIATASADQIRSSSESFKEKRRNLVAVAAVAVILSICMALVIHRSVMRSLGADPAVLRQAAEQVSSGDLSPLHHSAAAPAGSVLRSLGDMQGALAAIVSNVRGAATAIESGSQEISAGGVELSTRTERQAGGLQQSASAMEQVATTSKQNADTSQLASQISNAAREAAERGGVLVDDVVDTITDITQESKKIADITALIDGIAFQTNILALNAAVEAARAGEQGRGFAVVAGEVRTLAQRSANAAREIKALIDSSATKVERGAVKANTAGAAMKEIVREVTRVAKLIGEISDSSREQTLGMAHVSTTVAELDQTTQQNAALVEEMAASADALNQQAQQLVRSVAVFALRDTPAIDHA